MGLTPSAVLGAVELSTGGWIAVGSAGAGGPPDRGTAVGSALGDSGWVVPVDGLGVVDEFGVVDGFGVGGGVLAGGGASGTVGDVGATSSEKLRGSTARVTTAQDTPTPTAARSSRRRAAVRRIAS
ncbi:hypothetical protein ACIQVO_31605 [Streptomyces sp. NPDC101062]|uniref:hypothetical protein n=1 Tax=unclassified Streptomyces TaxID=2593676 RepID=UPI0037F39C18